MGGRNMMNNIIESTKLYDMKIFYLQTLCVLAGIVLFQDSSGQNLVPFANNTFNLGTATRNWKTLFVNNINASGNITAGGTLRVTGISSLGGVQIKGPTTFIGFGSGVLTTNASGVLSSGPLTAAQIPLLPYLPLSGGTLTGPLNGTNASFTGLMSIEGLQITGGTLAAGNVLTSDINGNATWQAPQASSNSWSLTGNSGTVDGTNFIGTTDNVPLTFRADNFQVGRIDFRDNAFFGLGSGGGTYGSSNAAIGSFSLYSVTTGNTNTAMGGFALYGNTIGNSNVAAGYTALVSNKSGNNLTAIGYSADVNADGYSNSTAIGNGALITASNIVQLGNGAVTKVYAGTGNTATLVAGGLQITGGTLAAGNVLTSDAMGNATWQPLAGSSSNSWSLTGNSGTVDGTNFIGTTDATPLSFRVNNIPSAHIDFDMVKSNTFFGYSAGASILGGGLGGNLNTAFGFYALAANTSGLANVAIGMKALNQNINGSQNVASGPYALAKNQSGNRLTAIGFSADVDADGYSNSTAIGNQAIITGSNIIQLGNSAVTTVFVGTGNTATLVAGGLQITGGTLAAGNVLTSDAMGNATWQPLAGSSSNSWSLTGNSGTVDGTNFIGTTDNVPLNFRINNKAAGRIDPIFNSTSFGYASGGSNANNNSAFGSFTLSNNTPNGLQNTAVGSYAMNKNTTGYENVGLGIYALTNNISGNNLTAIGSSADVDADGYSNSTAIGSNAMITASDIIQLGNDAVTKVYAGTGTNATLVAGGLQITGGTLAAGNVLTSDAMGNATWQPLAGSSANSWSLTGNSGTVDGTNFIGTTDNAPLNFKINNTAAGRIDFSNNTLFGLSSGGADGTYNTAIGNRALTENNGGKFNTAIGFAALFSNQNGLDNVGVGYNALDGNSSGNGNVGVGVSTLQENSTGYNLTAVGNYVDVAMDGYFNSTAIGYGANIDGSNEVILGNNFITSIKAQVNGITTLSDGRFKKNINENVPGLEFIKLLRPVTYNYNIKGLDAYRAPNSQSSKGPGGTGTAQLQTKDENAIIQKEKILYTGLIAQDVESAAKKIKYNFSGLYKPQNSKDTYGLSYVDFVVPLIKAAQQLSASNDSLQSQITDLQNQLNEIRAQVASLASSGTINKENTTTTSIQLSSARLEQNAPNPFNQSTLISYYVPQTAGNATIMVTDINGRNIKTVQLGAMGSGQITLQTSQLMSGTYTYSLYVDGNLIDTKKMILAK